VWWECSLGGDFAGSIVQLRSECVDFVLLAHSLAASSLSSFHRTAPFAARIVYKVVSICPLIYTCRLVRQSMLTMLLTCTDSSFISRKSVTAHPKRLAINDKIIKFSGQRFSSSQPSVPLSYFSTRKAGRHSPSSLTRHIYRQSQNP
jgi:hypothetical protein